MAASRVGASVFFLAARYAFCACPLPFFRGYSVHHSSNSRSASADALVSGRVGSGGSGGSDTRSDSPRVAAISPAISPRLQWMQSSEVVDRLTCHLTWLP